MSYVYVMTTADRKYYKIGRSKDPEKRLRSFQTGFPMPLQLCAAIRCKDSAYAERILHQRFAASRRVGEWFSLDIEAFHALIAHLPKVAKALPAPPSLRIAAHRPRTIAVVRTKMYYPGNWAGNQVLELRIAYGLGLEDLAREIKLGTYASVYRWECGEALPSRRYSEDLDKLEQRLRKRAPGVIWERPSPVIPSDAAVKGDPTGITIVPPDEIKSARAKRLSEDAGQGNTNSGEAEGGAL